MMKLGDFTVEGLGVHHSDYFQGYGTGTYSDCVYGTGNTEAEALDNCIEALAMVVDFDDDTEQAICDEYGHANAHVTALDECDVTALDDYPDHKCPECGNDISDITFGDNCADCGQEFDYPEHVPSWHVGIKWHYREEQRIERIRNLPNVEPLDYSDYCPTGKDSSGFSTGWGHVTRADGSGSYGDFHSADWPESAASYVSALSDDQFDSGDLYFYVPYASGSDYSGSTVEAANYKWFVEEHGNEDWTHEVYGGYGTYAFAIGLTGLLACDEDTFDEICEAIEGLEDYPLIDDQLLHEVESDNTEEAWNSWVSSEFTRELERACDDAAVFEWPDDSELRSFFEEKADEANCYWYCEGGGSDMYIDVGEIVAKIAFDDYAKWVVHYKLSYYDPGEVCEYFIDEYECIERKEALLAQGLAGTDYIILQPEATVAADAAVPA
jgi:hypothetical protein